MNTGPVDQEESLRQLIGRLPGLVEHFYNDAPAPHFSRAGTGKTAPLIPRPALQVDRVPGGLLRVEPVQRGA